MTALEKLDLVGLNRSLTPYVGTLSLGVVAAVRSLLQLDDDWTVRWQSESSDGPGPEVRLELGLPAGGGLRITLAKPSDARCWKRGRHVQFSYNKGIDGIDPHGDPVLGPALEDIAARLLAADADAPERIARLWSELEAISAFRGISDHMYRYALHTPPVTTGVLRLGFRCNQNCYFCWQGRKWPEPPAEYYFTWLDEIAGGGVESLTITGGEPTLHKSLVPLIERAVHVHGMRVGIQTNCVQMRKPRLVAALVEAGVENLFVSFHSHLADISDAMTRARGTHKNTVIGIQESLRQGIRVELNCMVEQANVGTLVDHATFIHEHFVEPFPDNPVSAVYYTHASTYFDGEQWQGAVVPLDQVKQPLVEAVSALKDRDVRVLALTACGFPPCVFSERHDLLELIDPLMLEKFDREERHYGEACGSCAIQDRCTGVRPVYLQRFGERGLVPFSEVPDAPTFVDEFTDLQI